MPRWLVAVLAGAFLVFTAVRQKPPAFHLDVGSPGAEHFLRGFGPPQAGGAGAFRWSRAGAKVVLHGAVYASARLTLELDPGPRPTRVRVTREGALVGELEVARGWRSYSLDLPAVPALRSPLEPETLEIGVETPQLGAAGAELGVKLSELRLTPHAEPPWSWAWAAPRALVLAWSLGLLAGALLRLDAWITKRRPGAALRVGSLVLVVLVLAAAFEHRDPYGSAWLYPFAPLTLSLLTLGLCLRLPKEACESRPASAGEPPTLSPLGPRAFLLLAVVFALALGMRFHRIQELPWAMWRDEARHAMVGLQILHDPAYRPLYVPHADLPALGLYPFALALDLWGIHPWSLRPMTAFAGALTVLPLFGLARRLTRNTPMALLAAALLAVSSWHVSMSRLSFVQVFEPLFTLMALWLIARSVDAGKGRKRMLWACGSGLALAVAFQTYHTGRLAPLLAAWLALVLYWRVRPWAPAVLSCLLVFAAGVAPLVTYARKHTSEVSSRVDEVSLLARAARSGEAPLAALDASLARHLLMFNVRGDANGRHHAPGRPLLDLVTGLGFLAGLFLLAWRRRRPECRFLLGALALTLLPGLLAVDGPHAGRTIGAAAFACLIAAIGWSEIQRAGRLPRIALAALLALAAALNAWSYFVAMPTDPRVWGASYPVETQMGVYVRALARERGEEKLSDVFVPGEVGRSEVFRFLTHGLTTKAYENGEAEPLPSGALVLLPGDPGGKTPPPVFPPGNLAPAVSGPPFPGLAVPSFMGYRVSRPE